jgi:hypothetical protein
MPADPITALAESTLQLHEMFLAAVKSGFTEAQAMQIVLTVISASLGKG